MRIVNHDYENYRWVGLGNFYFEDSTGFMYEKKKRDNVEYFVPLNYCSIKSRPTCLNTSCLKEIYRLHKKNPLNVEYYVQHLYSLGATGTFMEVRKMVLKEIQRLNEIKNKDRIETTSWYYYLYDEAGTEKYKKFLEGLNKLVVK